MCVCVCLVHLTDSLFAHSATDRNSPRISKQGARKNIFSKVSAHHKLDGNDGWKMMLGSPGESASSQIWAVWRGFGALDTVELGRAEKARRGSAPATFYLHWVHNGGKDLHLHK